MFNIPVISSSSRHSPESCGMMHLNALNGSSLPLHHNPHTHHTLNDNNTALATSCLPSYEEAVTNAPLFGLFSVNGGDSNSHYCHHPHHHHQHQQHQQQEQQHQQDCPSHKTHTSSSYSILRDLSPNSHQRCPPSPSVRAERCPSPSVRAERCPSPSFRDGHPSPAYAEQRSSPSRSEVIKLPRPSSRLRSSNDCGFLTTTNVVGERFEMEEPPFDRLSRISIVSSSSTLQATLSLPPEAERRCHSQRQQETKVARRRKRRHILCACASLLVGMAVLVLIILMMSGGREPNPASPGNPSPSKQAHREGAVTTSEPSFAGCPGSVRALDSRSDVSSSILASNIETGVFAAQLNASVILVVLP